MRKSKQGWKIRHDWLMKSVSHLRNNSLHLTISWWLCTCKVQRRNRARTFSLESIHAPTCSFFCRRWDFDWSHLFSPSQEVSRLVQLHTIKIKNILMTRSQLLLYGFFLHSHSCLQRRKGDQWMMLAIQAVKSNHAQLDFNAASKSPRVWKNIPFNWRVVELEIDWTNCTSCIANNAFVLDDLSLSGL
jgi:hypothetical protein